MSTLCRYSIVDGEIVILVDDIQLNDISLRENILFRTVSETPADGPGFVNHEVIYRINDDYSLTELESDPNPPQGRRYFTVYHDEGSHDLFSENADGSDRILLANVAFNKYMVAYNKIFYFSSGDPDHFDELWYVNPDGTDATPLSSGNPDWDELYQDIFWSSVWLVDFDKEYIYLTVSDPYSNAASFFRMSYDGKDRLNYPEFLRDYPWHERAPFEVMAGWIYSQTDFSSLLMRMRTDGSGQLQIEPFE